MQLFDLVKPISEMTDEELLDYLRQIRHRRTVVKPATRKRVERAEKKASRGRVSKVEALLSNLSEADREALLKKLSEE